MAWGNFLLTLAILYPAYYGLNFLIDMIRTPKKAESEEETFTFEDLDQEETFLLEEEEEIEVSPSSSLSNNTLFNQVETNSITTANTEDKPSEIIEQPFKDFASIQDQGIPVLEFRSKAKELAASFKF